MAVIVNPRQGSKKLSFVLEIGLSGRITRRPRRGCKNMFQETERRLAHGDRQAHQDAAIWLSISGERDAATTRCRCCFRPGTHRRPGSLPVTIMRAIWSRYIWRDSLDRRDQGICGTLETKSGHWCCEGVWCLFCTFTLYIYYLLDVLLTCW